MARIATIKTFTPEGLASYPHITVADNKFGDKFSCKLIVQAADAQDFIKTVEDYCDKVKPELLQAASGKVKAEINANFTKRPYDQEYDDNGELTGNIIIKSDCNKEFTYEGRTICLAPTLYDAQGVPLKTRPQISSGSKLKLQVELIPYPAFGGGVKARLKAVQIVNLVGGANADAGFGASSGSYVAAEADPAPEESPFDNDSSDY